MIIVTCSSLLSPVTQSLTAFVFQVNAVLTKTTHGTLKV